LLSVAWKNSRKNQRTNSLTIARPRSFASFKCGSRTDSAIPIPFQRQAIILKPRGSPEFDACRVADEHLDANAALARPGMLPQPGDGGAAVALPTVLRANQKLPQVNVIGVAAKKGVPDGLAR